MIVCSCNVITEDSVKDVLYNRLQKPSVGTVLKELGHSAVCGSCSISIKFIIDQYMETKNVRDYTRD